MERFVKLSWKAEYAEWERRLGVIDQTRRRVPSVTTERIVPEIANAIPHLLIDWDPARVRPAPAQVIGTLREGKPPIILGRIHGASTRGLLVSVFLLEPGEVEIVARRLEEVLRQASG